MKIGRKKRRNRCAVALIGIDERGKIPQRQTTRGREYTHECEVLLLDRANPIMSTFHFSQSWQSR
jgi:hypothetical protein